MDFSKLRWRIDLIPIEKNVITEIPELQDIFREHIEPLSEVGVAVDTLIRYIIYAYSKTSPLVEKMLEDVRLRKKKAFEYAGAIMGKYEEYDETVNEIMQNENEAVGHAVIQFLKFENSVNHMQITLQTEALYQYNYDLIDAKKGADKTSTVKAISDLTALLDKLKAVHFKMDGEMGNFIASAQIVENRRITPEDEVQYRKTLTQ